MTEHELPTVVEGSRHDVVEGSQHDKERWTPPVVRETIPARKTAGGGGDINDQDDIFYVTSS
jgi:hypothetical protein